MSKTWGKTVQYIFYTLILGIFTLFPFTPSQAINDDDFPKLANYFLDWDLTEEKINKLANWDVAIISAGAYTRHPELVQKLKTRNPSITIFIYIVAQEINDNALNLEEGNFWKETLQTVNANDWFLYSPQRSKTSTWPATSWINSSSAGKVVNGEQFTDWLARRVSEKFLSQPIIDGVFYDNLFDNISWTSTNVDIDNNGSVDSVDAVNARWREGMINMIRKTQQLAPNKYVIANAKNNFYNSEMNGRFREHFPGDYLHGWKEAVTEYTNNNLVKEPKVFILNANNNNIDSQNLDLRKVRFTYGSSLLGDGFFTYTAGDQGHNSLWWYDEYDLFLGKPISQMKNINGGSTPDRGVFTRDFDNGVVYVNTTQEIKTVTLIGELEKIRGTQAPTINNGAIVRKVTINPDDAILLQKRVTEVTNAVFPNGSFVKPFDKTGMATDRNGFFVSNSKIGGNDLIANIDINDDGQKETVVADNSKIIIYNPDFSLYKSFYPYGTGYKLGMTMAIGDTDGDGKSEIITGTKRGFAPTVKVFSFDGTEKNSGFFAYDKNYKGGVNVAACDLNGDNSEEIVVGAGYFGGPQVRIFNAAGKLVSGGFFAYAKTFRGGVRVACGDIDGNDKDEIITGAGIGGSSHVRMFDGQLKALNPGFFATTGNDQRGVNVFTADLDNNGAEEIMVIVPNPF